MGKGLSEFRKASDDFKRTWEREVAMETAKLDFSSEETMLPASQPEEYLAETMTPEPLVQSADPELVVARGSEPEPLSQSVEPLTEASAAEPMSATAEPAAPGPLRKQEWL